MDWEKERRDNLNTRRKEWESAANSYLNERSQDAINPVAWLSMKAKAAPLWLAEQASGARQPGNFESDLTNKRDANMDRAIEEADKLREQGVKPSSPWLNLAR